MKKLIYAGAIALFALGFVACSEAVEEIDGGGGAEITVEEEVSEEKTEELNKTLELQEEAEKLDNELNEYIESL